MSAAESKTLDESPPPPDRPIEAKSEEPEKNSLEDSNARVSDHGGEPKDDGGDEEEEEQGECGFCLYMKAGGCKESFVAWENCIDEAEKNKEDIVEKCFGVTGALKKCMEAHSDYYEPVLRAEKAAEAEAVREFEKEKEKEATTAEAEAVRESEKEATAAATPAKEKEVSSSG